MPELPLMSVKLNGDSAVRNVNYASGCAECIWEDSEGTTYGLRARTDTFFSEAPEEHGSVRLEIEALSDSLPIHEASGCYCAPPDFGRQMSIARQGYHLVLGRRHRDWPYLLRIRGYRLLLVCPLRAKEDVMVLPIG